MLPLRKSCCWIIGTPSIISILLFTSNTYSYKNPTTANLLSDWVVIWNTEYYELESYNSLEIVLDEIDISFNWRLTGDTFIVSEKSWIYLYIEIWLTEMLIRQTTETIDMNASMYLLKLWPPSRIMPPVLGYLSFTFWHLFKWTGT